MYRRVSAAARRLVARHRRALIATGVLLTGVLLASLVACCSHGGRPAPTAARPGPLPRSPGTIRVRLVDPTETAAVATTGPYRILADGHVRYHAAKALPSTAVRRTPSGWILNSHGLHADELRVETTADGAFVQVDGRPYRGSLILRAEGGATFTVDNHVPLEHYLAGVLACELLGGWNVETYKALAVAARTYAVFEMTHAGRRRGFDVYADQRSQVYGGAARETAKSVEAVRATLGLVLSTTPGEPHVFKAYYSSCCGGRTSPASGLEPQEEAAAPLAGGVVCTDCGFSSRYQWDDVRIDRRAAFEALGRAYPRIAALGPLRTLRVREATAWGRPQWLDVIAVEGRSEKIRADDLRLALLRAGVSGADRIYSMACTLQDTGEALLFSNGRGFGHSVGLCQYGAEGKARRGLAWHAILRAYYPGAHIVQMYAR
ncbi:MAG: SpoIID/LytB domain-containing protein [Planctomycetes bacterium]|nr:SpoIID/LytB domain-containing protein [Planctomycetota bacterium]